MPLALLSSRDYSPFHAMVNWTLDREVLPFPKPPQPSFCIIQYSWRRADRGRLEGMLEDDMFDTIIAFFEFEVVQVV